MNRIENCFAKVAAENRAAFVAYIMAGDPDLQTSQNIMNGLPNVGVDIIELGMPFSDPMADGPAIQAAANRSLAGGHKMQLTWEMVKQFRSSNVDTPIILMGYYNPIYQYGNEKFLETAVECGVDGLIIVDLPLEMDDELCESAKAKGLHFIRLATPATDGERLPMLLSDISGFLYYVSITGITGTAAPDLSLVKNSVADIKKLTTIPVCVGFGVKEKSQVREIAQFADGVVVGSAIVGAIAENLSGDTATATLALVAELSAGVKR